MNKALIKATTLAAALAAYELDSVIVTDEEIKKVSSRISHLEVLANQEYRTDPEGFVTALLAYWNEMCDELLKELETKEN